MTDIARLTGRPVISATGLFTPEDSISNEELVASFNEYVRRHNETNAKTIAAGEIEHRLARARQALQNLEDVPRERVVTASGRRRQLQGLVKGLRVGRTPLQRDARRADIA